MNYNSSVLPELIVNRSFMVEFVTADAPCFAMGLVEERGREYGFLTFRPNHSIPAKISEGGFGFGHTLLGNDNFEVIHFAFEFYGFETYNVLINPNNPIVQKILSIMLAHEDYFFFALNADNSSATAFRAEIEQDTLTYLRVNQSRLQNSQTTEKQYQKAVLEFAENPYPEGLLLNWVCRNNMKYLDLGVDKMVLSPG
ncbi:MAG: hypothetical protein HC930_01520 [Hydrococcus sp. SU_1_0]|nr:hypothetical protein [Hydrococcus sp. SU_1_0]